MAHLSVVLVGVEHPGNLGAVARAMKNFGVTDLVLIEPKCSPADIEAKNRAKWANDILERARSAGADILDDFDLVVGTTGKLSDDYNLPRTPLLPGQLAERLATLDADARVALLFGRESDGLVNDELALCDFTVTIPTAKEYPSLNLSHAVAIILYAITAPGLGQGVAARFPLVRAAEKRQLKRMIGETLAAIHFTTDEKRETQEVLWSRLVGKSLLTQREAMALMGFFRKVERLASKHQ
jgi:TrmH family RNA methyltransferase